MKNNTNKSTESRAFRPAGFRNLNQEEIDTLHNASLQIMEFTGMRFFDQEALDLIHETGPDGHFLETDHTLKHFRKLWAPSLLDRLDFETWSAKGSLTLQERTNQGVREIIGSHRAETLPQDVAARLDDIVARR